MIEFAIGFFVGSFITAVVLALIYTFKKFYEEM